MLGQKERPGKGGSHVGTKKQGIKGTRTVKKILAVKGNKKMLRRRTRVPTRHRSGKKEFQLDENRTRYDFNGGEGTAFKKKS